MSSYDDSRGNGGGSHTARDFTETVEISFHDVMYLASVSTFGGDTLVVEVEQKSDASRWRGEFSSSYIEDISSKTGNFKKFPVFVKMLVSALKQSSDSVFVDLLTYQDLELLKSRKLGTQPTTTPSKTSQTSKRYMILTYAAEFDRVHYPLPLVYEDSPDPQRLKEIIAQLRSELSLQKTESGGRRGAEASVEVRRLREENQSLRQQLKHMEKNRAENADNEHGGADSREMARQMKLLAKERDVLQGRAVGAEAELERERAQHRREMRKIMKELQDTQQELDHAQDVIRDLKLKVKQLSDELSNVGRPMERIKSVYSKPSSRGSHTSSRPSYRSDNRSYGQTLPTMPPARSTSRGRETASRERTRPTSAPARERFDPTAYVRDKKERERKQIPGARKGPSQTSSGRSSPAAPSRPTSVDRSRGGSATSSRPSSRDRNPPYLPRVPTPDRRASGGSTYDRTLSSTERRQQPPLRSGSPGQGHGSRTLPDRNADPAGRSGATGGWSKFPGPNSSSERATSPGRALQEVKRKLTEFSQKNASSIEVTPEPSVSATSPKSQIYDDASAEIADIDSKLLSLQQFIRMSRTSVTVPPHTHL